MELLWIVVLVVPIAVLVSVNRNHQRLSQLRSETVELRADEFGVRRLLADGREEEVDWSEVNEVEVVRASRGAHAAYGGVLVLGGNDTRGCLVPLDRLDDTGIRDGLVRLLPGFDRRALEDAISRQPPARVTCWVRPGQEPQPADRPDGSGGRPSA
jgi:hypothetical protein